MTKRTNYPEDAADTRNNVQEGMAAYSEEWEEDDRERPMSTLYPPRSNEFPRQGSYTIDDYNALPEDRRFELIDGFLIEMEAPSVIHQFITGELFVAIRDCIEAHGMPCRVLFSPLDVRLDRDNRTVVQPDVVVRCGQRSSLEGFGEGEPDFVAEILSKSNRAHDLVLKYRKYKNAGVREYWIIDPENRIVRVNHFEKDAPEEIYPFDSLIEVGISEGTCRIDFAAISREM